MIRLCFATTLYCASALPKGKRGRAAWTTRPVSESRIPRQPHRRRSVGAAPCREAWRCGRRELVSRYSLRPWARSVFAPEHSDCGSSALHFPCASRLAESVLLAIRNMSRACAEAVIFLDFCGWVRKIAKYNATPLITKLPPGMPSLLSYSVQGALVTCVTYAQGVI